MGNPAIAIAPLLDKVVVQPQESEEKTTGGLIVAGGNTQNLERGKVLAVGPGYWEIGQFIDNGVVEGDLVMYPRFAGTEHKLEDGTKVIFISSKDLVAKLVD